MSKIQKPTWSEEALSLPRKSSFSSCSFQVEVSSITSACFPSNRLFVSLVAKGELHVSVCGGKYSKKYLGFLKYLELKLGKKQLSEQLSTWEYVMLLLFLYFYFYSTLPRRAQGSKKHRL